MLTLFFMKEGPTRLRRDLSEEMKGQRGLCGKWIFQYKTLATVSNLIMIKISWSNLISHFQIQEMSFSKNAFSSQCIKYTKNKLSVKFLQPFIVLSFLYLTFKKKPQLYLPSFFQGIPAGIIVLWLAGFPFLFYLGQASRIMIVMTINTKHERYFPFADIWSKRRDVVFVTSNQGSNMGYGEADSIAKSFVRVEKGTPLGLL